MEAQAGQRMMKNVASDDHFWPAQPHLKDGRSNIVLTLLAPTRMFVSSFLSAARERKMTVASPGIFGPRRNSPPGPWLIR